MRFQEVALSFVQPGNHDELITHRNPFKPLCNRLMYFKPSVGSSFVALPGRFSRLFER
jgi:hypothetical protein